MYIFVSAKLKDKLKKDKETIEDYFDLIYPPDYTKDLVDDEKDIFKEARKTSAPLKGSIKRTNEGFVYVDVSNDVIHGMYSLLKDPKAEKPPYFGEGKIGAHISVIAKDELPKDKEFKDTGKEIEFRLGKLYSTEPEGWDEMKRVYFVEIESPDLFQLREKYNLPKTYKNKGHEFHITVGVEKK